MKAEIKGSFVWALWTTVVITTNVHPAHWFTGVDMGPLRRRLTEIRYCEHQGSYKLMDWDEKASGDFMLFQPSTPVIPPDLSSTSSTSSTSTSAAAGMASESAGMSLTEFRAQWLAEIDAEQSGKRRKLNPPPKVRPDKERAATVVISSDEELTDPDNHDPDKDEMIASTVPWPKDGDNEPDMGGQPV